MRQAGLDEAAEGTERRVRMTELKHKMTELKPIESRRTEWIEKIIMNHAENVNMETATTKIGANVIIR